MFILTVVVPLALVAATAAVRPALLLAGETCCRLRHPAPSRSSIDKTFQRRVVCLSACLYKIHYEVQSNSTTGFVAR